MISPRMDAIPLPDEALEEPELAEEAAEEHRGRGGRILHFLGLVLPPLIVAAVAIGVWYFATYVALDAQRRFLLPAPHMVIEGSFVESGPRDEILTATLETAKVALVGL